MAMTFSADVERWRSLVAKYFPPELVDKALFVIQHESGGDPGARGDGGVAIGLFQIQDNNAFANRPDAAFLSDPERNIQYAATQLGAASGNWAPWGEGVTYQGQPFGALGNNPFPGTSAGGSNTVEGLPEGAVLIGSNLARWLDPETREYVYFRYNSTSSINLATGDVIPAGWSATGTLPQPNSSRPAAPQGAVSEAELKAAGATPAGPGRYTLNGQEYRKNPDGTWNPVGTANARPLSSAASQAIAGASAAAQRQAGATGAAGTSAAATVPATGASGGVFGQGTGQAGLPNILGTDITAPQSSGVVAGDLLGQAPGYIFGGSNALGRSAYPIVADALPVAGPGQGQGQGIGFTPVAGTVGGNNPQFQGALGGQNTGFGFNTMAILGAAGIQATGNPMTDAGLALAAMNQRQSLLNDPTVAEEAARRGTTPEAIAQDRLERNTGANPSQGVTRIGNEFYDAMGMRLVTVGTGSKDGKTTIRPTTGSTSSGVFGDAPELAVGAFDDDIYAASGFTGVVNQPTTLHVAEGGQPEHVQVTPLPDPDVPVGPLSWSSADRRRASQPDTVESTDRPMPVGVAGFDQSVSMSDARRMNLPLSMVNVPISARPAGGDGVGDREARALGIGPERLAAMRRLYPEMGDAAILRMMASGPSVPYGGNQSRDAVQGFVSMMLGSARGRRGPGVPAVTAFRQGEGWT